ncbi:MAG: hypothetical protein ACSHXK_03565 [Oceanococcus sp.]
MFNVIASRLTQLMLLKAGPQDLPSSTSLLQVSAGLFFLSAFARMMLVSDYAAALTQSLMSMAILAVFVRSLLNWRKTPERFNQTLSALFLAGTAIGALLLFPLNTLKPLLTALTENPEISPQQLDVPAIAMYAWAGLSIWGLMISAHIFRHALGLTLGLGVCVSLLYEILLIVIVGMLSSLF